MKKEDKLTLVQIINYNLHIKKRIGKISIKTNSDINKLSDDDILSIVIRYEYIFKYLNDERFTNEFNTKALITKPSLLRYLKNQTQEQVRYACEKNSSYIQFADKSVITKEFIFELINSSKVHISDSFFQHVNGFKHLPKELYIELLEQYSKDLYKNNFYTLFRNPPKRFLNDIMFVSNMLSAADNAKVQKHIIAKFKKQIHPSIKTTVNELMFKAINIHY